MAVSNKDRQIIRELARRVAEIAALPAQQATIALWRASNGLKPVRPMVMIDQIAWHEMDVDGELALQSEDGFCRDIETRLRRTLYSWRHMPVDMVVEPVIDIAKVIRGMDLGVRTVERTAVTDPRNSVVGHYFVDQLKTDEDIEKIRIPQVALDVEATARAEEAAHDLFDGIIAVRMQGCQPTFAPWDAIVQWCGVQSIILELVDRPEFVHRLVARFTEAQLTMLDQLEEQGLLGFGQERIHCTGAYTDELPAAGFDPQRPRAQDIWTCGQAQIFSTVSPAMHQEFELDYAVKWYERFGLVYYGCCEPLDDKIAIIRHIPHVRKISMSPWVDAEKGAERIGRDFVFSRKPNPAFLAGETWRPEVVEEDLKDTVERCGRHGCPLELILKDISTVCYQPQRLWEWAEVAMRVVGA